MPRPPAERSAVESRQAWLFLASPRDNRLNEDAFRQLRADAKTGIANLANNTRLAAHQPNLLLFAKTHFAQAMTDFRGRGKLLDPHGGSSHDAAQGAEEWISTATIFT